jgi:serine/threonine-protein kinase
MISVTGSDRQLLAAALLTLIGGLAVSSPAWADVSASDKAAAEALFEHGKTLMKDGRFAEACPKLQESQRIDPGIGTMLYLGDCYEKSGRTASAWAQFLEAAGAAHSAGQSDREKKARDRALALEPKLNRLSITLGPGTDVPGLEVKRDGAVMGKALWATPVPVDPGDHLVEVSAPGKKPWSKKIRLDPTSLAVVALEIPALEDAPKVEPPRVEPPKVEPPKVAPTGIEPPRGGPIKALPPPPIVTTRDTVTPIRIVGGAVLGVGIASLAAGGVLGSVALLKKSNAGNTCHDNGVCSTSGADALHSARAIATGSNVTLIAGGGLFLAGVIILAATAPASPPERGPMVRIEPLIGAGTGGILIGGSF